MLEKSNKVKTVFIILIVLFFIFLIGPKTILDILAKRAIIPVPILLR